MWPRPTVLVAVVLLVGLVIFGAVLWTSGWFNSAYGWLIVLTYLALWYIFAVWVIVPVAVIAQSVRNKRHGVFSHLRRSSTKEVEGGREREER